jgi:hypothetical protein
MIYYQPSILDFVYGLFDLAFKSAQFKKSIGKYSKYYLPAERKEIPQFQLEMWPGYSAGIRQCADGIFLSVDVCAKFI